MEDCRADDAVMCPVCGLEVTFSQAPRVHIPEDPDDRPGWIWDQRNPLSGAEEC